MFTDRDFLAFERRGVTAEEVEAQLENFKRGFKAVHLTSPATIGDGIIHIDESEEEQLISAYKRGSEEKRIVKMVPASGSASRMFKDLFAFLNSPEGEEIPEKIELFFKEIERFPFYESLKRCILTEGGSLERMLEEKRYREIMEFVLIKGLKYGETPKGLVEFHRYGDAVRTPFDEHLTEGALYGSSKGESNIHFTISSEYTQRFRDHLASVIKDYEKRYGIKYNISFSIQKPSTDTVSVEMDGSILRDESGEIVFRPGGHGALIHNLNELDADVVFIKNIDNVSPDRSKADTCKYKKLLAGMLLLYQERIFNSLKRLESGAIDEKSLADINSFVSTKLGFKPAKEGGFSVEELIGLLNRPIRVCGMVKNEGEPGGGPFYVQEADGERLMICESAQIDMEDREQREIFNNSTHFNPVDLLCGIKNYKGERFDLTKFVAPEQGFINYKSYKGRDIKVQELPGLWNGSMAHWITLFVEVPLTTFTPVKTVFDLLKPEHQN